MGVLERGYYKIRGPGKLKLAGCRVNIMGIPCSRECDFVVPAGRTYVFKVDDDRCTYSVSPMETIVGKDELGELLYYNRNVILSKLENTEYDGVVFIGPPDSFKSTISIMVFNSVLSDNKSYRNQPYYITTDVGQNEIFMPTFISGASSYILPGNPVDHAASCFTGITSPAFNTEKYLWCITYLVNKLRSERNLLFIVDTDGWVFGHRAIYSKMIIAELFNKPLIVYTSLDKEFRKHLLYHFKDSIEYTISREPVSAKKSSERRRVHRSRLVLKAFKEPCRIVLDCMDSNILGLPVFHGSEVDPSIFGVPSVIYAESWKGKIIVVAENEFPYKRGGIEVLKKNWEQGLITALYSNGEISGIGLVEKIDYRKKKLSLIANRGVPFDYIEVGRASFPEVLRSLESSLH
ncbi:MAG: hypothetical protein F7B59_05300 [Desulfurococcales archaeon]|nr:hypothetical protein [Desulfurococcales archaeon]